MIFWSMIHFLIFIFQKRGLRVPVLLRFATCPFQFFKPQNDWFLIVMWPNLLGLAQLCRLSR